jgi:DNA-directed RNA polymerase II subunit RPB2
MTDISSIVVTESKKLFTECRWDMIDAWFARPGNIIQHQLESYNYFVSIFIPEKIYSFNPLIIRQPVENEDEDDETVREIYLEIFFENHEFEDPYYNQCSGRSSKMFPHDALLCSLTYSLTGLVDLRVNTKHYMNGEVVKNVEGQIIKRVIFGKIPIMIGSDYCMLTKYKNSPNLKYECKYDKGGYFIINGNEKVVISQEDLCDNRISVFDGNRNMKYAYICSVRSLDPRTNVSYKLSILGTKNQEIVVKISHIKKEIPLFVFFRAIGLPSDKKIIRMILLHDHNSSEYLELLEASIECGKQYNNEEKSLNFLKNLFAIQMESAEKTEYVKSFMIKNILPHLGETVCTKQLFLGYMVKNLLNTFLGRRKVDDRDHYSHKCVELPGMLLGRQFHYLFQKETKDMKDTIIKAIGACGLSFDVQEIILKHSIIDNGYRYSMATGDWNTKLGNNDQKLMGFAQVLSRMNYVATISHLRRINTPIDDKVKLIKPRQLHGTHFGNVCPAETPEGVQVGAVKNLTMAARVSIDTPILPAYTLLQQHGLISPDEIEVNDITSRHTKVFINGDLVGFHTNPYSVTTHLVDQRRNGKIPQTQSIRYNINANEITVNAYYGRCSRAFFIVDNGNLVITQDILNRLRSKTMTWNDLLVNKIIEYIDTEEQESCLIAMNIDYLIRGKKNGVRYTHCEIDESFTMLGVCASLIPGSDHNQSPRNAYQSSMCKQAIGMYTSNHQLRFDKIGHVLAYPQTPLVQNRVSPNVHYDKLPCGQNLIVAFGCWSGYNQEDSVIFNKSAIDRGLFESHTYRTYKDEESRKSTTNVEEKFCDPKDSNVSSFKHGNYDKLNKYGYVDLETDVVRDDVIIGKVAPLINKTHENEDVAFKDNSTVLKADQPSKIDNVILTRNADGYKVIKVKVRNQCTPMIGDKVSSRSGGYNWYDLCTRGYAGHGGRFGS